MKKVFVLSLVLIAFVANLNAGRFSDLEIFKEAQNLMDDYNKFHLDAKQNPITSVFDKVCHSGITDVKKSEDSNGIPLIMLVYNGLLHDHSLMGEHITESYYKYAPSCTSKSK